MKLTNFLANKAQTEFEVMRVEQEVTESNGEKIAVLYLKNPIPIVDGSMSISDDAGAQERLQAYDVTTVRIHQRDFEAEGIDIKEDGTGTVKTDLRLDVSNRGDVWLTSKSFNTFRREKAQDRRAERRSGITAQMQARKANALLKGANENGGETDLKPESVAGPEGETKPQQQPKPNQQKAGAKQGS